MEWTRPTRNHRFPLVPKQAHSALRVSLCAIALVLFAGCDFGGQTASNESNGSRNHKAAADPEKNSQPSPAKGGSRHTPTASPHGDNASRPSKPLLKDWPKPAVALLLSGEQHGYLEPCGCTQNQSGGVSRRADLVRQIEARGWPITAFDLGGTLKNTRRQSKLKFETMLAALRDMHYEALVLGPEELRLEHSEPYYLLTQHVADPDDPSGALSFLAANVVLFDDPNLGTPLHSKVVEINGQKIGVTAIVGASVKKTLFPEGAQTAIAIQPPEEALPKAVEQLNAHKPDLMVLLSHGTLPESRALAEKFPQFNLVLSAGGPEDPEGTPETIGKTMLVTVGHKGKYAGVVGFYPDGKPRLRFELVELDKGRFRDTPKMVEHMRYYQSRLFEEQIAGTEPPLEHPSGAQFVGVAKCAECHTKAYAKWKTTPHAHAYESLKHAREGEKDYGITRIYDAECLSCHVTGWHPQEVLRYDTGFINEEFARTDADRVRSGLLEGQQCENCHGPGSRHIELVEMGELEAAIKETRVTLAQAKKDLCYRCHDLDNSPNFEFDSYWKQIAHPGRD